MAVPFTIHVSVEGGTAQVYLGGEIDLSAKPEIRSLVNQKLTDSSVAAVTIDLSAATFLDSTGIGTLIGCRRMADESGKTLHVTGARGQVASVLDLTGVTQLLTGIVPEPEHDAGPATL